MDRKANQIAAKDEVQYHIGCKSGDIATNIILVGDPDRARKIANYFSEIVISRQHREYVTYTGIYQGFPITVMAIGIGQGNMEIAVIEIAQVVSKPIIIRCGTSSGLSKNIALGDMVIAESAYDLGNVVSYYKVNSKHLKASSKITKALRIACETLCIPFHVGTTASAPGFYGPQGRQIKGFPIKNKNITSQLAKKKILNLEMEVATMFALSNLKKIPVGAICSAIGNRERNEFLSEKEISEAEKHSIDATLKAFEILNQQVTK